jgi:hypothetical protein
MLIDANANDYCAGSGASRRNVWPLPRSHCRIPLIHPISNLRKEAALALGAIGRADVKPSLTLALGPRTGSAQVGD